MKIIDQKTLLISIALIAAINAGCGRGVVATSSTDTPVTVSSWEALATGMDAPVNAIVFDTTGKLYAAGTFLKAGSVTLNYIGQWNGTAWSAVGSGFNASVNSLAADTSGNVYAGGAFTSTGSLTAKYIAKWTGSTWEAMGDPGAAVTSVKISSSGDIYICVHGAFSIKKWNGSSWDSIGTYFDSPIYDIAFGSGSNVYAGGAMLNNNNGNLANKISRWTGTSWVSMEGGVNNYVHKLLFTGGKLYAGGAFTKASGGAKTANYIAIWDGSSWEAIGTGMGASVHSLAADAAGNIYAGGQFNTAGGVTAKKLAKWNGSVWSEVGGGMDTAADVNMVRSIVFDSSGKLYAAGDFTKAGGTTVNYIAKLK